MTNKLRTTTAILAMMAGVAFAGGKYVPLNTISYKINSEITVTTIKAKVLVNLTAMLPSNKVSGAQENSTSQLANAINGSKWKINNYSQSLTDSGLIKVSISLESRLDNSQLAKLTEKIKSLGSTGQQYKIVNIDYSPSLAEVEQGKNKLRLEMLTNISDQLNSVNKKMHTNYVLHKVIFDGANITPLPMENKYRANTLAYTRTGIGSDAAASMQVAKKIDMNALVEFSIYNKQIDK